jgi:hypothetical protein
VRRGGFKEGAQAHLPSGGLPARDHGAVVEKCSLIPTAIPAGFCFSREQFDVRASDKPLDALPNAVGLPTMFPAFLDYQPAHVLGFARGLPAASRHCSGLARVQ